MFNLFFEVDKNKNYNHALLGYEILFLIAFKLRIMTIVSVAPLSEDLILVTVALAF